MSVINQHLTVDLMSLPFRGKGSCGIISKDKQRDNDKFNYTGPGRFHENSIQLVVLIIHTVLEYSGLKVAGLIEIITECLFVEIGQGKYAVNNKRKVFKTDRFPDQSGKEGMQADCIVQNHFRNQPNGLYMSCCICYWT